MHTYIIKASNFQEDYSLLFFIFSYWSPPVISFTLIKVSSGNVPLFAVSQSVTTATHFPR